MKRRTRRELEQILATRVHMTYRGQVAIDLPLEALYHIEKFFGCPIPLDTDLSPLLRAKGLIDKEEDHEERSF